MKYIILGIPQDLQSISINLILNRTPQKVIGIVLKGIERRVLCDCGFSPFLQVKNQSNFILS